MGSLGFEPEERQTTGGPWLIWDGGIYSGVSLRICTLRQSRKANPLEHANIPLPQAIDIKSFFRPPIQLSGVTNDISVDTKPPILHPSSETYIQWDLTIRLPETFSHTTM